MLVEVEIWDPRPIPMTIVKLTRDNIEEVAEWVGARSWELHVVPGTHRYAIFTPKEYGVKPIRVYVGEYILRDQNGRFRATDVKELNKYYQPRTQSAPSVTIMNTGENK